MDRAKKFPRRKPKSSVRDKTDPAGREEYEAMAAACVAAIATASSHILLSFPYFCKFSADWPKRWLVEQTATNNIYRVNARTLLDWLHGKGYSRVDSKTVVESRRLALLKLTAMEKSLDAEVDSEDNNEPTKEGDEWSSTV